MPMPGTFTKSSRLAKAPCWVRYSMILAAVTGPIPLISCSCASSAVLMFTKVSCLLSDADGDGSGAAVEGVESRSDGDAVAVV